MAQLVEQVIAIKMTKLVKDSEAESNVLDEEKLAAIVVSVPELIEGILDDPKIVVEVVGFE